MHWDYPSATRSDHVDIYKSESKGHVSVHDPYNWLESDSVETNKWIDAQVHLSRSFIDASPFRSKLEAEFLQNNDYEKFHAPRLKEDGRWYWYHNTGLQSQSVLYRCPFDALPQSVSNSSKLPGEIFFDPNLLTEDGTAAITISSFSNCGKYWAYGISLSGSDFSTVYVRSTESPYREVSGVRPERDDRRMADVVRYIKFSHVSWTHDSKGFFYQRFPTRETHGSIEDDNAGTETSKDLNAMLCYHRLGTSQDDDILVMKDEENPTYQWSARVSEPDGRFLELAIRKDTSRKNKLWICDLSKCVIGTNMSWIKVVDEFEASFDIIHNQGGRFFIVTNKETPFYKVVTFELEVSDAKFEEFISEDSAATLQSLYVVNGDWFAAVYRRDVKDELHIISPAGQKEKQLTEEFVGTIDLSVSRSKHPWFFVTLTGFTSPGSVARYDFPIESQSESWSIWRTPVLEGIELSDFLTEQVFYNGRDGTRIPMFLVRHKSSKSNGTAPAVLYGYGGFGISITPSFNASNLTFLRDFGGIYAIANIRGGLEYGEDWQKAGSREKKVNCFHDFIDAAEYLVENKIAGKGKIAINGGSNGGLLVATCINMAPEGTFGAAVAQVGVMDLLKFDEFTIGRAWTSDYGDPKSPHDFDYIYPISPLHNVPKDIMLPPTLLQTADHDDRVVPLHSYKLAATLQYTQPQNPNPLLICVDRKAGHGAGKSTRQRVNELADKFTFIAEAMHLDMHGAV